MRGSFTAELLRAFSTPECVVSFQEVGDASKQCFPSLPPRGTCPGTVLGQRWLRSTRREAPSCGFASRLGLAGGWDSASSSFGLSPLLACPGREAGSDLTCSFSGSLVHSLLENHGSVPAACQARPGPWDGCGRQEPMALGRGLLFSGSAVHTLHTHVHTQVRVLQLSGLPGPSSGTPAPSQAL